MPRILIIDDDRAMTMLLQRLLELEPQDFDVDVAPTGAEALRLAQSYSPDLIMIDFNLSDVNGIELLKTLREQAAFQETPIIMSSGMDVGNQALAAGANQFLLKPFEPGDIADIFMDLIG